ncbi:MAG: glucose-1-phosphate adenylyltransferase subunit GlgD, partial [Clostridia bacterium]|nr:glucose-1-phosphate adenylyltransferase subunit GlgD [Clostridia bacterium]
NSLIADGCVIEGEVNNCILFRGGKVEKCAKLSNCIIMQDSVVRSGANLKCVITDKNTEITEGRELAGAPTHYMTVRKNSKV